MFRDGSEGEGGQEGSTNAIANRLTSFGDFSDFVGLRDVVARSEKYA